MRLTCLLALLSAALSAGAANACCFLKCWKGGHPAAAPAVSAVPAAGAAAAMVPEATPTFYVKVVSVDGQAPDLSTGNIPLPTAYDTVVVKVEADYWDAYYGLRLYLYDTTPPPPGPGPFPTTQAQPKVTAQAKLQPTATFAAGTGYPVSFTLTGLSPNRQYTAYVAGYWASTSVTFKTKP